MDDINLVDSTGKRIGTIEKLEAHKVGKLHEAFSIFVINRKGETLLQRRALHKYHSGGLWTNTCCSHPRVGEKIQEAVHRRLQEEMGFDCELTELYAFEYRAEGLANGLIEHEYDHVFLGRSEAKDIKINPDEVHEYKWISFPDLKRDVHAHPEKYTAWLLIILEEGRVEQSI
jgi:isopentenyl-diphosphate delta-isomerase